MSDDEYLEWLKALAQKHLRHLAGADAENLTYEMERLTAIARLARAVADRSENEMLIRGLIKELNDADLESVVRYMEIAGVLSAIDELPEVTLGELRRSAIPDDDVRLLARAGVDDSEAEIAIIIQQVRLRFRLSDKFAPKDRRPSEIAHSAQPELSRAGELLLKYKVASPDAAESQKKRKIFNAIGKLLGGSIAGAGNLLLVTGTIIAPNPATAAGAIASGALAIGSIFQGIGDLRGE